MRVIAQLVSYLNVKSRAFATTSIWVAKYLWFNLHMVMGVLEKHALFRATIQNIITHAKKDYIPFGAPNYC